MLANPSSRHLSRLERMASPAMTDGGAGLPRSTSVKAPATPTMLGVNDDDDAAASHQPARASISTPAAYNSRQKAQNQKLPSVKAKAAATPADTPGATPKNKHHKPASHYASMWSPRKLMERASRAFRGAGRSRRKKSRELAVIGETDSPRSVASMGSDATSVLSLEEQIVDDVVHGGAAGKQDDHHLEAVPEKIIHEANLPVVNNHQPPAMAAEEEEEYTNTAPDNETDAAAEEECPKTPEKETAAAEEAAEVEEELKKGAAPAPAPVDVAVTDCKVELVKEAAKKREEEIMTEVVRRFQGCRVKTSTEKRSAGDEQPRRRASNEVIEEARTKLLEMRKGSRVKALVGAFETVMDANSPRSASAAATAGKPHLHHVRTSTV